MMIDLVTGHDHTYTCIFSRLARTFSLISLFKFCTSKFTQVLLSSWLINTYNSVVRMLKVILFEADALNKRDGVNFLRGKNHPPVRVELSSLAVN